MESFFSTCFTNFEFYLIDFSSNSVLNATQLLIGKLSKLFIYFDMYSSAEPVMQKTINHIWLYEFRNTDISEKNSTREKGGVS